MFHPNRPVYDKIWGVYAAMRVWNKDLWHLWPAKMLDANLGWLCEQNVIEAANDQWRNCLRSYVSAGGGHFEHMLWNCCSFVSWQEPAKMYIYSVPAQEMAKHCAKFGWLPLSDVAAVTKPRHKTRWNLLGCPKLMNRSQPLVGQSLPYIARTWGRYCCLTTFFQLSIRCALVTKIEPYKVVRWCQDGEFLAIFWVLHFQRAACSTFQTCILNSD